MTGVLMEDAKTRGEQFHQLPYHRMLLQLFWELTQPDAIIEQKGHASILDFFG